MKSKLFAAGIVGLVGAALSGCPKTPVQSRPPGSQAQARTPENGAQTYSHDAKGLEQEYDGFFQAASSGDTQERDRQFAVFTLPDMSAWFGQYFAKEQVQQLGWDYEAEGAAYEKSLLSVMKKWPQERFYAHCKALSNSPHTDLQPRADAVQPSRLVPLEQFAVEFVADGAKSSQIVNFVYVDGAFRYMGKGAYPFWSMPDKSR